MVQIKNNINTALLSASMALVIMAAVQTIMLYLGRVTEIPPFLKLSVPSVLGMIFPMLIKRSCMRVTYRKARKLYTAAAICFGVGSCTGLNFLFSLFRLYFSGSSPASSSLSFSSPLDAALTITAAAIVPAVFEELLFRGTIIPVLGICGKRFSIVVSAFIGLAVLGEYNNYMYIYTSVAGILNLLRTSMQASIGNSIAVESEGKNHDDFRRFHCLYIFLATWCAVSMLSLYQPFITVWIGKDYLLDNLTMVALCVVFFWGNNCDMCMTYRHAAGLWWQDRYRPVVESIVNVILCLVLVKPLGVLGVVLSSFFCKFVINSVWASWVLYRFYFKSFKLRSYLQRLMFYLGVFIVTAGIVTGICSLLPLDGVSRLVACCLWSRLPHPSATDHVSLVPHSA